MKRILGAAGLMLMAVAAFAQEAKVTRVQVPLSGTVVLADVKDPYHARVISLEAPSPDGEKKARELQAIKEQSARIFPRRQQPRPVGAMKTTAVQIPQVTAGFVADSFPGIPPDNYMAINRQSQAVNVMNSSIAVLNSATGQMTQKKSLGAFSTAAGLPTGPVSPYGRYDPKVMYDPEADRFICMMLAGRDADNFIVIGFSQTADPSGAWNIYKFYGGADSTWFDYPTIAITKHEFFLSGNLIWHGGGFQNEFVRSRIYQIRKSDGYSGLPLTSQIWDQVSYGGRPIRNIFPVKGGGGLKGRDQYFLNVRNRDIQNDTVFLMRIPDTIGSAGNNITVQPLVADKIYGVPPDGRQPDDTFNYVLQTNDGRVLGAFMEGGEIQFTSTTVQPVTGNAAIYHGRITNYAASPTVTAQYIGVDTLDFGYPNISYAGTVNGHVTSIISFDYTGPTTFPGLGAVHYDGTGYSDLLKVKTGVSYIKRPIIGDPQRWGDYTGSQPDWTSPGSVWIVGIFGRADHNYGNWMAQLKSPINTSVPKEKEPAIQARLYPNPAYQYVQIYFDLGKGETVRFAIVNTAGQLVDDVTEAACAAGKNELTFNVGSLPAGQYFLKATGSNGQTLFTRPFTRN